MRRLLSFAVLVSGLLTLSYILITTASFWTVASRSQLWSEFDNLTSSVFIQRHDDAVDQGPPGVAAEVRPHCLGRPQIDDEVMRNVCRPLLAGEETTLRPGWTSLSDVEYAQRTDNCACFRRDLGYYVDEASDDERSLPIAFSVLTYESVEQTERLLRLIYRPHNVYCVHVDAKSSSALRETLTAIAACFNNVFIAEPPVDVSWGKVSVVHAEMLCMRQLLDAHEHWRYFINVVARDFPLRTNYELVKILQAYDGANDVQASRDLEK